jgi:FkbM family methyltransferase
LPERRIVPDDHVASIEHFLAVLADHGAPAGVVHVGAHEGQEVDAYLRAGCERVALVEANPEHCATLRERFAARAEVTILEYAVTDVTGRARLHLHASRSGDTQAASLLGLKRHREVGVLRTPGTIDVPAITLDDLFARHALDPERYDLLTLDVQGVELRVLHGGGRVLGSLRAVVCEVALMELYDGTPAEETVVDALAAHGLGRIDALYYEMTDVAGRSFPAWGDGLFLRG